MTMSVVSGWGSSEGFGPVAHQFVAYQPTENKHLQYKDYNQNDWYFGYVDSDLHPREGRNSEFFPGGKVKEYSLIRLIPTTVRELQTTADSSTTRNWQTVSLYFDNKLIVRPVTDEEFSSIQEALRERVVYPTPPKTVLPVHSMIYWTHRFLQLTKDVAAERAKNPPAEEQKPVEQ